VDLYSDPVLYGIEDVTLPGGRPAWVIYPSDDGAVLAAPIPPRTYPLVVLVHGMRPAKDGVLCPGDISKDYQAWERVLHLMALDRPAAQWSPTRTRYTRRSLGAASWRLRPNPGRMEESHRPGNRARPLYQRSRWHRKCSEGPGRSSASHPRRGERHRRGATAAARGEAYPQAVR